MGYGLLAGAGGITVLMLAWLAVSGAEGGGVVLGLLLLFVLAGPLAGAGWYVLGRQRGEASEEASFAGKRRILEADRAFRAELAAELRQLARRPSLPTSALEDMAEDLVRGGYDTPAWYDTVQLADADVDALRRYDDLVWERARWLGEHGTSANQDDLNGAVRALQEALDQRRDLLLRGRRAPAMAPAQLVRAAPAQGAAGVAALAIGDALSYEGADYLAEGVASYFAEGRTWKLFHLVPSGPEGPARWLYVGPGAVEVALLDETPGVSPLGETVRVDDAELPLVESGSATADVGGEAGRAEGVLVSYRRYADTARLAYVERWPDGATHAYSGGFIRPSELQVWPAAVRS